MALKERPKPFLLPEYCKGCGRCIDACAKDCITAGHQTIFTHPLKAESEQPFLHLRIGLANEL